MRLGVLVNPWAGLGGPLALKGSDHLPAALRQQQAAAVQAGRSHAQQRLRRVIEGLLAAEAAAALSWVLAPGAMAAAVVGDLLPQATRLDLVLTEPTTAEDTARVARALQAAGVELLLFAGGDGTARVLCDALGERLPVLGVPSGVKMHSGVFAINPAAAVELLALLARDRAVALETAEVRDIDEADLAGGRLRARTYGHVRVPVSLQHVQQVKCGGVPVEGVELAEVAAAVVEALVPGRTYAFGPGHTVAAVMDALGLENTLLGFDLVRDGRLLAADVTGADLLAAADADAELQLVIAPTGGQGSLIGRGNQQLSPALLRRLGRNRVLVLATPTKLQALGGRPLRLDSGDAALDRDWSVRWCVLTGYQQTLWYPVQG